RLENMCIRSHRRFFDAFLARDWPALSAACTEDAVDEDRRRGLGFVSAGRVAFVDLFKGVSDVGITSVDVASLATRGDRKYLMTSIWGGRDYDAEMLVVCTCDESGLISRQVAFNSEDIDDAFAEL